MMFDNGENFMKILITGGTTFVSKFAAEYFVKSSNHVTVINRGSRKQIDGVNLICCDRMELKNTLKEKHYDVILDITAYTDGHIRSLLDSGEVLNKTTVKELFCEMIIDCIERLKQNIGFLNITQDFIFYMCDSTYSSLENEELMKKTVDSDILDKLNNIA